MRKSYWTRRGKISSSRGSAYKQVKALEYLAILAVRHNTDASDFLGSIMEAWKKDESQCKQLAITCRERTRDSAIFLFTAAHETVAQFPISITVLQGDRNQLEPYMNFIAASAPSVKKPVKPQIKDLRAGMKQVNLKAKVLEIPEPNTVFTRSGTESYVTNALIGDVTGTARLALWNEQIKTVSKDDLIEIENGEVTNYRGELQLRIRKGGRLSVIEET